MDVRASLGLLTSAEVEEYNKPLHARVEELIGACMRDAGFAYKARPLEFSVGEPLAADLSPLEAARTYGFMIASTPAGAQAGPTDPNDQIVAALTGEGAASFRRAQLKCTTDAEAEVRNELVNAQLERSRLDAIRQRVAADPRLGRAGDTWRQCMADGGVVVADVSPNAMRERLSGEWVALAPDDPAHAGAAAEFAAREKQLAVANVACESPYREVLRKVEHEAIATELDRR